MSFFRPRNRYIGLTDFALLAFTPAAALAVRLDTLDIPPSFELGLVVFTAVSLAIKLGTFVAFGLYNRMWRYASIDELVRVCLAAVSASALSGLVYFVLRAGDFFGLQSVSFPRSLPLLDGVFTLLVAGGVRFSVRAAEHYARRRQRLPATRRVLIVGAGSAGTQLARELRQSPTGSGLEVIGFLDDDPAKRQLRAYDLPVLGPTSLLADIARKTRAHEVLVAMPSAPGKTLRTVVEACNQAGLQSRILPGLSEIAAGKVLVSHLRPVKIEDLLGREPVVTDLAAVRGMLAGRRVLVTGAGGSIGSELVRQIARSGPAQIIALGHGENSLFQLASELRPARRGASDSAAVPGRPPLEMVVADIRDRPRLKRIFERYRPQVVFHAAAHKHVPLMESNVEDAVTNNVLGTRNLVELAEATGVERFVLISSDKAVNPTSVMGVTKRIAELIVAAAAQRCRRPFVSVRFGNVLGSRGSVLPTFRQQIADGGPLTITHPEMQRYFMTIPEAVQLVLQAAVLGEPGRVFVLDMGQPVKMVDLARDLVRLSGLELGRDIDLEYTGLRPGEKLFEELFGGEEHFQRTAHDKIFVSENGHRIATGADLADLLDRLLTATAAGDAAQVRRWLEQLVPEYQPSQGEVALAAATPDDG